MFATVMHRYSNIYHPKIKDEATRRLYSTLPKQFKGTLDNSATLAQFIGRLSSINFQFFCSIFKADRKY